MLNTRSLDCFEPFNAHLLRPRYADYGFGNIPTTVEYLLTGEQRGNLLPVDCFGGAYPRPRTVAIFLIDAFGWHLWQQYADRFAGCGRITEHGTVTPISALFPSTTAASITTMNLGVLPAQHALYEWYVYIPAFGAVIQTLPFMPLGEHQLDAGLARGYDPSQLLAEHETLYARLARHNVRTYQFLSQEYTTSAYNRIASAGAAIVPYATLSDGLTAMREAIATAAEPAYLCFYWDRIDAAGHRFGPGSVEHEAAIADFWQTFERVFAGFQAPPETLFLFTADHGQVRGNPADTIALNHAIPGFADYLQRTPGGEVIRPNGGERDVFLHVQPAARDEASARLQALLGERATVLTVDEALTEGLFGPPPFGAEFRRRAGDLLILPHGDTLVWWQEPGISESWMLGYHGGLTAPELLTFIAATERLE